MKRILLYIVAFVFVLIPLILAIHGRLGNPSEKDLQDQVWVNEGPFELSPERGRFALIYSLIENGSLYYSVPLARFTSPDVGYINGKYVSLFAPAVSFIAIPAYIIGHYFGISQIAVFSVSTFFALANFLLIFKISRKLNVSPSYSWLAGLVFVFATPAFAYSTVIYQHHISAFLILASIYLYLSYNSFVSLSVIWLLCAASIPVDYPNLFLMLPIGLAATSKIVNLKLTSTRLQLNLKVKRLLSLLSVVLPLSFFLWFNYASYSNPLQFSGTVASVKLIDSNGLPAKSNADGTEIYASTDKTQSALSFFWTRDLLHGFYIHLISPDRGLLIYSPILLFGLFIYITQRKLLSSEQSFIFFSIVGINLLLYSMWGDPWGGWAFGSRYLIPSFALLSILGVWTLYQVRQKKLLRIVFFILFYYSVLVNSLGAITSNQVPPGVEIPGLEQQTNRQERFSIDRNFYMLLDSHSKSFLFNQLVGHILTPSQFWALVAAFPLLTSVIILFRINKYGN